MFEPEHISDVLERVMGRILVSDNWSTDMAQGIKICDRQFRTKTAATKHYQSILNNATCGEPVTGEAEADVLALLERHPEKHAKKGVGIKSVIV